MDDLNTTLSRANEVLAGNARKSVIAVEDSRVRTADPLEYANVTNRTTNHHVTADDRLGLYRVPGWHGLGQVVEDEMTGREACEKFLGWSVEQFPVYTRIPCKTGGDAERVLPLKANLRSDTKDLLGVVGPQYVLVQNHDIGDFADALLAEAKSSGVKVRMETVGSLLGGRKVFLTMRPEKEIRVGRTGDDVTIPLLTILTGHDGTLAMTGGWTYVRTVCNNTLTSALGSIESDVSQGRAFRVRHSGNVKDYLASAKLALGLSIKGLESYQLAAEAMAATKLSRDALREFFADAYRAQYGNFPENPKTEQEETTKMRADRVIAEWYKLMGDDCQLIDGVAGTLWAAFNAITQYHDHVRTAKTVKSEDRRNHMKLLGTAACDKRKALRVALAAAR